MSFIFFKILCLENFADNKTAINCHYVQHQILELILCKSYAMKNFDGSVQCLMDLSNVYWVSRYSGRREK